MLHALKGRQSGVIGLEMSLVAGTPFALTLPHVIHNHNASETGDASSSPSQPSPNLEQYTYHSSTASNSFGEYSVKRSLAVYSLSSTGQLFHCIQYPDSKETGKHTVPLETNQLNILQGKTMSSIPDQAISFYTQ